MKMYSRLNGCSIKLTGLASRKTKASRIIGDFHLTIKGPRQVKPIVAVISIRDSGAPLELIL